MAVLNFSLIKYMNFCITFKNNHEYSTVDTIYFFFSISDVSSLLFNDDNNSCLPPRYHHVAVPGSNDRMESYLTLAVEAALICKELSNMS